jgi:type I restriction enzyme, S subunit
MTFESANEPWLDTVFTGWPSSRIRNVAQLSPRYSNSPPEQAESCTVVPMEFLSEDGKLDTSSIQTFGDVSGGLTLFEAGDVLFAKITPCMENGKGAFVDRLPTRYAFGSTEFHVLRPNHAAGLATRLSNFATNCHE